MLIGEIFDEFIGVVRGNHRYTIGLINENKIISLCSDRSQIGKIINFNQPDPQNAFFQITIQGQEFGYLWVSGQDDNLEMISKLLYESLYVRLLYEINQSNLNRKVTKDDELVKLLLKSENFDLDQAITLFDELGLDPDHPRVAIYVINEKGFNIKDVMRLKMKPDSREVIYSLLNDEALLIFKDVSLAAAEDFETVIRSYIQSLIEWGGGLDDCFFYVGSIQRKVRQYFTSYQTCLWLKNHISCANNEVIFLSEHMYAYFLSKLHVEDIKGIYGFYLGNGKEGDIDELIRIADELKEQDFNVTKAAEALFLHKNTLLYKLRKYEEMFHIDVRGSFEGKFFLTLIAYALQEQKKMIQVGDKT